jgi:hypothetical protein
VIILTKESVGTGGSYRRTGDKLSRWITIGKTLVGRHKRSLRSVRVRETLLSVL